MTARERAACKLRRVVSPCRFLPNFRGNPPEPRSKFQLWNFAAGTRSAAGLRIRLNLLSLTPCSAGPSTTQPPSPNAYAFQAGARWELIQGCCLALDSARLPPLVFVMLLLLILVDNGDNGFPIMALRSLLREPHLAAMARCNVQYSAFGLLALSRSHQLR